MLVGLNEFDITRFSFGEAIVREEPKKHTIYPALYDGEPFSLILYDVKALRGIREVRNSQNNVIGFAYTIETDKRLYRVLQAIYKKASTIEEKCHKCVFNGLFTSIISKELKDLVGLNKPFWADATIRICELFCSDGESKVRYRCIHLDEIEIDSGLLGFLEQLGIVTGENEEGAPCVVCERKRAQVKISPCLHTCLCMACSQHFQTGDIHNCPLCQREINSLNF